MASVGVSSGTFTGSDFVWKMTQPPPKPAVPVLTIPTVKAVNNTSYYDGVTKKSFSDILKGSLPSSSTISKVKTGLDVASKSPRITPAHLLVGAITSGALYGLNQLYPDDVLSPVSSPVPAIPTAIVPSSQTPPQTINEKTVQIINNFSPEILGKLKVDSDTDLITALINASVAQNQSSIMNTSVLNTQLGMLNEQFFGLLAYLDLFLQSLWDGNELLALNTASNYDTSSESNSVSDTIAESVLRVGDKLTHFSENQEWFQSSSSVPSFADVVSISPRDAEFAKNYEHGKGEADTNSIGAITLESVEELFNDMDLTPTMLKDYVRFDTILNQAKMTAEGDVDAWDQLMEDFFR